MQFYSYKNIINYLLLDLNTIKLLLIKQTAKF